MSDDSRSRSRSEELEDRVDELGDKFAKRVSTLESDARKVSTEQRKSELKSLAEAEQDPESALVVFDDSTEEERKERRGRVIESFDVFDFTDNGTISMGELASIMFLVGLEDPMARERVAAQMNIKDGEIQRDDFLAAMGPFIRGAEPDEDTEVLHKIYAAIQEEQVINLRVAFEACDDDDSGEIDRDELALVMAKLGENPSAEELDAMYDELNEDGEGGIDFQEFITFMCKRGAMGMFNVDALMVAGSFRSDKVISPEESARIMKEMPVLERLGANFMKDFYRERALQRRNSVESKYNSSEVRRKSRMEQQERERMAAEDRMQLMKQQRKDIKKMERIAIGLDMLLGALSAIISGFAEEVARDEWRNDGIADDCKAADNCSDLGNRIVYFWLLVGGVSLVATVAEVVLIYYVHLKISIRISRITGLKLFPVDKERAFVTAALARAALELPHPAKKEYGVDPLEEASKARLFVATLVYKAKTGLSTFIIRIMLKRVLARAAVKSLLSFVAVPVNMFWNALIGYKCLRQVRVIALGPSLAQDVMGQVLASRHGNISDDVKVGIIRAIATVIVTKEMMHPNMQILLKFTKDQLGLELSDDAIGVEHVDSVLPPGGIEDARRKSAKNPNMSRNSSANADEAGPADVELEEVIVSPSQTTDDLLGRNDGSSQVQPDEENGRASASTPVKDIAENNDGVDGDDDDSRRDAFDRPGRLSYFIAHLDWLNDVDKLFVLRVLCFAMILDGHVSSSLASVFRKVAFRVPGVEPNNLWPLHLLTLRFIRGELKGNDIIYLFDEQAGRLDDDRKPLGQGFRGKCNYYTDRCLVFFSC